MKNTGNGQRTAERKVHKLSIGLLEVDARKAALEKRLAPIQEELRQLREDESAIRIGMMKLMRDADLKRAHGEKMIIDLVSPRLSVKVNDLTLLPKGFFELVRNPLKAKIKDYFNETGDNVPGAEVVEGEYSIAIRK